MKYVLALLLALAPAAGNATPGSTVIPGLKYREPAKVCKVQVVRLRAPWYVTINGTIVDFGYYYIKRLVCPK